MNQQYNPASCIICGFVIGALQIALGLIGLVKALFNFKNTP